MEVVAVGPTEDGFCSEYHAGALYEGLTDVKGEDSSLARLDGSASVPFPQPDETLMFSQIGRSASAPPTEEAASTLSAMEPTVHEGILNESPSWNTSPEQQPPSSSVPKVCANCHATSTPFWRRAADGNMYCNACGLYLRAHKTMRPVALQLNRDTRKVKARTDICANCGTRDTPLWRRIDSGETVCNACGLYYKLHGSHKTRDGKKGSSAADGSMDGSIRGGGSKGKRPRVILPKNDISDASNLWYHYAPPINMQRPLQLTDLTPMPSGAISSRSRAASEAGSAFSFPHGLDTFSLPASGFGSVAAANPRHPQQCQSQPSRHYSFSEISRPASAQPFYPGTSSAPLAIPRYYNNHHGQPSMGMGGSSSLPNSQPSMKPRMANNPNNGSQSGHGFLDHRPINRHHGSIDGSAFAMNQLNAFYGISPTFFTMPPPRQAQSQPQMTSSVSSVSSNFLLNPTMSTIESMDQLDCGDLLRASHDEYTIKVEGAKQDSRLADSSQNESLHNADDSSHTLDDSMRWFTSTCLETPFTAPQ